MVFLSTIGILQFDHVLAYKKCVSSDLFIS